MTCKFDKKYHRGKNKLRALEQSEHKFVLYRYKIKWVDMNIKIILIKLEFYVNGIHAT